MVSANWGVFPAGVLSIEASMHMTQYNSLGFIFTSGPGSETGAGRRKSISMFDQSSASSSISVEFYIFKPYFNIFHIGMTSFLITNRCFTSFFDGFLDSP